MNTSHTNIACIYVNEQTGVTGLRDLADVDGDITRELGKALTEWPSDDGIVQVRSK